MEIFKRLKSALQYTFILSNEDIGAFWRMFVFHSFAFFWSSTAGVWLMTTFASSVFIWFPIAVFTFIFTMVGWFIFGAECMMAMLKKDGALKDEIVEKMNKSQEVKDGSKQ